MTKQFRTACEKALACCNTHRPTIEFLQELAKTAPEFKDRIDELVSKLEHTQEVAEAGLHLMDSMSDK